MYVVWYVFRGLQHIVVDLGDNQEAGWPESWLIGNCFPGTLMCMQMCRDVVSTQKMKIKPGTNQIGIDILSMEQTTPGMSCS